MHSLTHVSSDRHGTGTVVVTTALPPLTVERPDAPKGGKVKFSSALVVAFVPVVAVVFAFLTAVLAVAAAVLTVAFTDVAALFAA